MGAQGLLTSVSGRVAAVVGTPLTLVTQYGALLHDWGHPVTWLRVFANYAIPYVVSSAGLLSARRRELIVSTRLRTTMTA